MSTVSIADFRTTDAVHSRHTSYRPDIDGLRAFSILSVVIFHSFAHTLPGGFIGVDIFFVISGFLISGIILRSLDIHSFSYMGFYSRRIKRIFPTLIVVLVSCVFAGWFFLFQDEWKKLGKHVAAGAAFISNIALMRESGYFDAGPRPLLHLWSLGIEEQFYIVWPLLLALVWRRRSAILPFLLFVFSISFFLNIEYVSSRATEVFYFPATRFWELTLGAILAYIHLSGSNSSLYRFSLRPRVSFVLSIAGMALLVASLICIDEKKAFPGVWALIPTAGAFFIIAAGPRAWFNRVVLSSRVMVFLGLISYPLYLWHWPMLFFAKLLSPRGLTWPIALATVFTAIALSWLTYRFIETPLRHHRSTIAVSCMLAASVGSIGLLGLLMHSRLNSRLRPGNGTAVTDWDYPFEFNFQKADHFQTGVIKGQNSGEVLFVGDSHIEQYYSRVKALKDNMPGRFPTSIFLTYGGCPPLPEVNRIDPFYACDKFFNYAMTQMNDPKVKKVVLGAFWEEYFGYDTGGDRSSKLYRTGGHPQLPTAIRLADIEFNKLGSLIASLNSAGKRVFVVLSNPVSSNYNPKSMISRGTGDSIGHQNLDRATLEAARRPILDNLIAAASRSGAVMIDPMSYFCNATICRTTTDEGVAMYIDNDHIRSSWVARAATFIDQIYKP